MKHRAKKHLEARTASVDLYKALLNQSADGILISDGQERFIEVNPRACEMLAYTREEMLGRTWQGVVVAEDWAAEPLRPVDQIRNSAALPTCRLRGKDGRLVPVEINLILLANGDRLAMVRDITEHRRVQETLRQSEERFASTFRSSPGALGINRVNDGTFIDVNESFCSLLGYQREEVIGQSWWALNLFPYSAESAEIEHLTREHSTLRNQEITIRTKTGILLSVLFSTAIIDLDGEASFLTLFFDITEHKRLETQLLQAQKMDTIGQLAGGIAHDFNNMLTAIIGCIGSAQEQLAPEDPVQSDLQIAESSAWRAAGLTRQLLAFARKQIFEPRVLDLNEVIVEMDKLLRRLIGNDIELITLPASDLGQVKADPGQIEQVLANLVVNARDAMPAGGRLTIETANALLDANYARQRVGVVPGEYVMLAVSDTGVGMASEIQQYIFEPFFTTKEIGKGTGLGLATCYGIIKQHGGNIWVYSEIDQGTTFKIYLPRVNATADQQPRNVDDASVPGGTEIVLLVEDEPLVREITAHILRKQGYTVLEAGGGDEALRIARDYAGLAIALVITDVVMPQIGGKALAEQIRRLYPTISVLFISGYATNAIAHHGQLEQGINFLSKPFTPAALLRKVRKILDTAVGAAP